MVGLLFIICWKCLLPFDITHTQMDRVEMRMQQSECTSKSRSKCDGNKYVIREANSGRFSICMSCSLHTGLIWYVSQKSNDEKMFAFTLVPFPSRNSCRCHPYRGLSRYHTIAENRNRRWFLDLDPDHHLHVSTFSFQSTANCTQIFTHKKYTEFDSRLDLAFESFFSSILCL